MKFLLLFILCISLNAFASMHTPWSEMRSLGKAKLDFAFFDIYEAELFVAGPHYEAQQPHALSITYLKRFKSKHLIKETRKQIKKIESVEEDILNSWMDQLGHLFSDVDVGDTLTLFVDEALYSHFYLNNTYLGVMEDREFSRCFSGIWLSEKTSRPKLRLSLIGEN